MREICERVSPRVTYHLSSDVEDSLEVELAPAFLEEVLERLTEQVHYHDMVHFSVFSLLIADEMKEGDKSLSSELVNELALPEQHDVALHFNSFFLQQGKSNLSSLMGQNDRDLIHGIKQDPVVVGVDVRRLDL